MQTTKFYPEQLNLNTTKGIAKGERISVQATKPLRTSSKEKVPPHTYARPRLCMTKEKNEKSNPNPERLLAQIDTFNIVHEQRTPEGQDKRHQCKGGPTESVLRGTYARPQALRDHSPSKAITTTGCA
eukprot:1137046-Pelagomonas_calceolata.AAC.2